jgi:hypothetical protein
MGESMVGREPEVDQGVRLERVTQAAPRAVVLVDRLVHVVGVDVAGGRSSASAQIKLTF